MDEMKSFPENFPQISELTKFGLAQSLKKI